MAEKDVLVSKPNKTQEEKGDEGGNRKQKETHLGKTQVPVSGKNNLKFFTQEREIWGGIMLEENQSENM